MVAVGVAITPAIAPAGLALETVRAGMVAAVQAEHEAPIENDVLAKD
jgi:hypothetical protein